MQLGKLGVWNFTDDMTAPEAAAFAQRLEAWGYAALWIPEAVTRNSLVHAAWLLANTKRLVIATGIANIYARDAVAMNSANITLNEQSGGRFLLGIGVSHAPLVQGVRGHEYRKPIATMRTYLEAMKAAVCHAPPPPEPPQTVLAALGPQMLALARDLADGAHPYNVTPEHTAQARAILGAGKWLCVEQKVLLENDPVNARKVARAQLGVYLGLDNYRNNWLRLGFSEAELSDGGSDRFIDAIVAWGDEAAIRKRIQQHWDAGADQVCIKALNPQGGEAPDEKLLALLAPAKSVR
jgi:probable F420-dependent oxidoreductase